MKNATNVAPILFSLAAGQHVVQTAESDVIAPTVTAEDPLALLDEAVRKRGCRSIVHFTGQGRYTSYR